MSKDRDLGMDRKITRRDFIEGTSVAIPGIALHKAAALTE